MFFYNKAVQLGENPDIKDYSYPGPRPQSREAAIVMLADSVEASSRTLVDPTPARIRAHVTKIVKGVYAEGQLDESDLTFRDLNKVIEQFVRIITGHFHQRIAYPDAQKAKARAEEKAESKAEPRTESSPEAEESIEELKPEWVMPVQEKGRPAGKTWTREKAETDRPVEPSVAPNAEKAAEDGRPRAAGSVFAAPSVPSEPRPSAEADA